MSNSWDNVLLQLTSKLNTVAHDYNLPITCFVEGDNLKNREIFVKFLNVTNLERFIPCARKHFNEEKENKSNVIKIFDYSKLKKNSKLYSKTEAYKKNIEDFYNDFIDFCQVLNEEV